MASGGGEEEWRKKGRGDTQAATEEKILQPGRPSS